MKKFIYVTLLLMSFAYVTAEEREIATLKVQYSAYINYLNPKPEKPHMREYKYILQIGEGSSYYYDPQTYYVDSLENDPTGSDIRRQALVDALRQTSGTKENPFDLVRAKGLMADGRYKCKKNFSANLITAWDINGADVYQYDVDMNDLSWELCDSTTMILDYECQLATADYHGRKWRAWFTSEIPVQDGPWQLCGLPGLIMKADTDDGEYGFEITGLQQCNEQFKPIIINPDKLFKTKRKSYLKMKDYSRRNRSAIISAMTNGNVKVNADYKGKRDFIETDYHE